MNQRDRILFAAGWNACLMAMRDGASQHAMAETMALLDRRLREARVGPAADDERREAVLMAGVQA